MRVCVRARTLVCIYMCVATDVKYSHIYLHVRFVTLVSSHVCASVSVICTRMYVFVNMCVYVRVLEHHAPDSGGTQRLLRRSLHSVGGVVVGRAWIDGG